MSAIAAVLVFSSTALIAQAAPETTQPATATPATPVPETAPVAPTTSEPSDTTVSDPLAAAAKPATTTTTKSSKSTTTHRTATVARPAKAAPPAARAAASTPVAAPVTEPVETVPAAPAPLAAVPAAPPPAVAAPVQEAPAASNNMLPIAGAVALGLLALIGLAVAMRRRKLRREEDFAAVDQVEPAFEGPATVDPLFAGQPSAPLAAEPAVSVAEPALAGPCADAAPGSHVEAACEGPSEDNPSLSIKKRLKRAQFFDHREQLAAAGMAVPVATDAGLPDAGAEPESAPGTRHPG
jgi:resuscitation-promoting factor RpfA